ncbi:MAG: hypothetical protein M1820_004897 [Bogoriella megaspora]|nr:MAG: hypothetical protein M1820_004897 [Bogoriella megaspora]
MSSGDGGRTSRPLSVAIPEQDQSFSGPYCPMRPRLADILANTAPPPWTLSAFMAYLSQNHCLETLEFTMDAGRYRKHYQKMLSRANGRIEQVEDSECEYLRMLWSRLLEAYIRPNGEREVNLPSNVRDNLINYPNESIPPPPECLDLAVQKINELMEDSVLYPFLSSFDDQVGHQNMSSTNLSMYNTSQENLTHSAHSASSTSHRLSSRRKTTPPPASATDPANSPKAGSREMFSSRHISAPASSSLSTSLKRISPAITRNSHPASSSSSTAGGDINMGLTDDSASGDSPIPTNEIMTPPTTPPTSEYGSLTGGDVSPPNLAPPLPASTSGGISPRTSRDGNSWKKGLSKLGWKKRSMPGMVGQEGVREESEDSMMDLDP